MTTSARPLTIVLTGATAGIGLQSALQLGAQGHRLVLVGRNPDKLAAAAARVLGAGATEVDTLVADFSSLDSVRALADELRRRHPVVDVLVNNAGAVHDKRRLTVDGHESTFAVNHLAGFLLTELVKDLVVAAPAGRIVLTASTAHFPATMDFDDLGFEQGYSVMKAYGRSKLANVLYARSLAAELADTAVTVNSLHPGAVATDIWAGAPWFARPVLAVAKLFMVSPEKGGSYITALATGADVAGRSGEYHDQGKLKEPSELARDVDVAARLHEVSAQLVGVNA
ncbi:SDR family oxidoreductase [soil metagenome]